MKRFTSSSPLFKYLCIITFLFFILLNFYFFFPLNNNKQTPPKIVLIPPKPFPNNNQNPINNNQQQQITNKENRQYDKEEEYFNSGILNLVEPYEDNNVKTFKSQEEIKEYFFPSTLQTIIRENKFNDKRNNKNLFTIDPITKQIKNKEYNKLKVHTVFNFELPYKDDFIPYPKFTIKTKEKFCDLDNLCKTEHANNMCSICDAANNIPKLTSKVFYKSWCYKPNIDYSIISIEDGILDYGSHHPEVRHSVFDKYGNLYSMPIWHPLQFKGFNEFKIEYLPKLASVSNSWYPVEFGHFPIEILPRFLLLNQFLPLDIPIVLYHAPFVENIINQLRDKNVISKERKIIWGNRNTYYVASRLYFLFSKEDVYTPLTPDIALRIASKVIRKPLDNTQIQPSAKYVLVVDRSDASSRSITNLEALVQKLRLNLKDYQIIPTQLSKRTFFEIGKLFNGASAIIAPHGAGLANLIFSKPGTLVLEVGWHGRPQEFHWPGDYYCFSRGLGLNYYAVAATSGHHYTHLTVDVDEINQIVTNELA
ncbi:hypothetical protein ABK040_014673 [Willaertia magna]